MKGRLISNGPIPLRILNTDNRKKAITVTFRDKAIVVAPCVVTSTRHSVGKASLQTQVNFTYGKIRDHVSHDLSRGTSDRRKVALVQSFPRVKPRSGELRTQKLKSHLVRTQRLNSLPLKPGVGQYIATNARLTANDIFLANFNPSGPYTCYFCKTSPDFSCVGCG